MIENAKEVLNKNWREGYTIPSGRLYPFQWNWDSGFIALGLFYYDFHKAIAELSSLMKGQWGNGMLPHIIFHYPNANYFPGPEIWQAKNISLTPPKIETSGITQPPVLGFILERMDRYNGNKPKGWNEFLRDVFPKVVAFHRYLYNNRDPYNEGLVYIHHNWESGTDNSPIWDDILNSIDISITPDISELRKDNKNVDDSQRPTNENYRRYIYLVELFKRHQYNDKEIVKECPFIVQDVLFNSMLVKSNLGLIALAEKLSIDSSEIKAWNEKTISGINSKLWDKETGFYFAYDLKNKRSIRIKTSSGFMPMFSGVCNKLQAEQLVCHLTGSFRKNNQWNLCPSVAADEQTFNPVKYWRGPVWININWILYHGLMRYGKVKEAEEIKTTSLKLINEMDMYEYYDARPVSEGGINRGLGADTFSWTAALYLDFLNNPQLL